MDVIILATLSGLSFGMVLFLIATGLSIILGLMGIVNLAHGSIAIVGLYVGITIAQHTDNYILGLVGGALAAGLTGLFIERVFLRSLYKQVLPQILITFGFVYIIQNVLLWIWGAWPLKPFIPDILSGSISINGAPFPVYRIAVIIIGFILCLVLWFVQDKTKTGSIIRAGMDDAEMVAGMGINLRPITAGTFVVGSFLAGLATVIGVPLFGAVIVSSDQDIFFMALAVVVIGGLGSVQGALVGALLIGIARTFSAMYAEELSIYIMYLVMIIILIFRPYGLLGRKS